MNTKHLNELKTILGEKVLLTKDNDQLQKYGRDWFDRFPPSPSAVVFPTSAEDVRKIVKWARKTKIPLVPSGGRTGLSGGAIAQNSEVIVSLEKMDRISPVDPVDMTVSCQAGVITERLQNYVRDKDYLFPVDLAARGSCQIGGNVSTNAGGINVVRYGSMRDWVTGMQVVTGTGEVLDLNKSLIKNATGYDLRHLFIGSEGTLGIITDVTLKLMQSPHNSHTLLLGTNDVSEILSVFQLFRDKVSLKAFEVFTDVALKHVLAFSSELYYPFEQKCQYYLLVEMEQPSAECDSDKQLISLLEQCSKNGWIVDGVLSQSSAQSKTIWRYRENITEATAVFKPHKNDISVRLSKISGFLKLMEGLLKTEFPDLEVVWYGHIGDGNIHINVLNTPPTDTEKFNKRCQLFDLKLFELISFLEGSVSAEHGVGVVKKAFLHYTRSKSEIEFMKKIKIIFDPDNIMNPGKIFDI